MASSVLEAAGGLGLFLLGMVILSQGLRDLAGAAIHRSLQRFTRSPASGALTGALATALVQSSSVTTVTAVGFASAGLLAFPQALCIVFGANIGTTVTGWIVALIGFKLQLGVVMPLLVLLGALLRIFGRGRVASAGLALAAFGLAFVGIEMLRAGTSAFQGIVTPDRFPADTLGGRLQLVGFGVLFTVVTQSSSAGVATALAAIAAGALQFEQAAALVIGMDVGTTVTAGIASVGASLAGRRTGCAHVFYNCLTGVGALFLLPVFRLGVDAVSPGLIASQPEFLLVGFHTLFNTLGVLVVLPFTKPFAHLVERLIPERPSPFTNRLDPRLLADSEVALRALAPTLEDLADQAREILRELLDPNRPDRVREERRELLQIAMDDVERYLTKIAPTKESVARRNTALHVVDQLNRLLSRQGQHKRVAEIARDPVLAERASRLSAALDRVVDPDPTQEALEVTLAALCADLARERAGYRDRIANDVAPNALAASDALTRMDAYRWLERVAHHSWRIAHHLRQLIQDAPTSLIAEPPEPD